ncbi:Antitoxin CptB [Legionella rubrilucens]|uniref:FAD assembly factor SdhE n=1 Tax=Legionella rubrilucens TaxID=458 RepID=A0A0W0XYF8_9GAMM|nr:succinate dehydrogenase assembly factor 2 [Legionella rubrilucens]KTD49504.1 Antitoxin CptB [Legionella rubrilucens]
MMDAARKAKLTWQCRRGMLELDLLLNQFLDRQLEKLNEEQIAQFEILLQQPDPVLYSWLMGSAPANRDVEDIVRRIQLQDYLK